MIELFENTPYRKDKNLIKSYNSFMELLPDNSWALFRDADTLFLDPFYGELIYNAIEENPDTDCFTCVTNRIGCLKQKHDEYGGDDIRIHRKIAEEIRVKNKSKYIDFNTTGPPNIMSGMVFILSKNAWSQIGGFKRYPNTNSNILGVDNQLHLDLSKNGFNTKIIKSLYVYHWYRGGDITQKSHLL